MRGFLALVVHEINQRKALLAAAAVASLLPLAAPLLPATGSNPAEDIREAVLWVMVGGLVPLFALLLGVSFIGRDLAEGRLGFYYAQPLSGPTIWFGKLGAVLLLIWAVELIIMLPTVSLSSDPLRFFVLPNVLDSAVPKWLAPVLSFVAAAAVVLVAHAAGIIWRARSAWLIVDTLGLIAVFGLGWLATSPFLPLVAPDIITGAGYWMFAWLLVALTAAGAVQAASGRVDPARCHRVVSMTLWGVLTVSVSALLAWSLWVRSADIDDLDRPFVVATGPGDWIVVGGTSWGRLDYYPRFLFNVVDGRTLPIGPAFNWSGQDAMLAEGGSAALWLEPEGLLSWVVMTADLAAEHPVARPTGVTIGEEWEDLAIAADGTRFAVLEGRTLAVYQGQPAEQLTAVRIEEEINPLAILFDDRDRVRVLASSRQEGPIGDKRWWLLWLEVADRRVGDRVEIDLPWRWGRHSRDGRADHSLIQVRHGDTTHVAIRDTDSGELLRDLEVRSVWNVRPLEDGGVLVIRDRDENDRAELYGANGEPVWTADLPEAGEIFGGLIGAPNLMLLGVIGFESDAADRTARYRTLGLDLATGSWRELADGKIPVLGRWGVSSSMGSWAVGSIASRLLVDEDGLIFLWDPETGEIRQLVPVVP
jgi:hypothetical protein